MISAFKYIMNIFWFLPVTELDIDLTPMFVGLFLVFLFTIASVVFEIGYYQLNHRFAKWSMYIVRFLCHYVTQVMVHPCAAFTGNSLYLLINFSTGQFWGFFIMGCIMTLGNILIFAATSLFCANSTIFDINLTSTFNPKPLILTLTINAACIIANYIFKMFPLWTILVLQVLHAVFCCFSFIKILLFIDFHTVFGNAIYISVSFLSVVMDVISIIIYFVDDPHPATYPIIFIILAIVLVVSTIVFYIVVTIKVKRMCKLLNYPKDEDPKEDENYMLYDSKKLSKSENLCLCYLRIAFTNYCRCYTDFSLIKYCANHFTTNRALCLQIKLLACFPGENRQLNSFFSMTTSKKNLSIFHRFLLYQVYRLKTLRQSSASTGANERLLRLKNLTKQCIADVCGFWTHKEPDISYFEVLAKEERKLQSLWLEAIRECPNSSKYCEEFIRFLSECTTDFQHAIIMKERADYIDMGKSFSSDNTFKAFLTNFPLYIKKNIIDLKGNFRTRGASKHDSSNGIAQDTSSSSLDLSIDSQKEIDAEVEAKLSRILFSQAKLRLALYHALKGRSHPSVYLMPYISFWSCIITIAGFIGFFFYDKELYAERAKSVNFLNKIAQARFYMGVGSFSLYFNYMQHTDKLGNIEEDMYDSLENDLMTNGDIFEYIPMISPNFSYNVLSNSLTSRQYLNSLFNDVANLAMSGTQIYTLASELVNRDAFLTICWDGAPISDRPMNLKSLYVFTYFLQQQLAIIEDFTDWYRLNEYCQIMHTWGNALAGSTILFQSFSDYQVSRGTEMNSYAQIIEYAGFGVILAISFLPMAALSLWFVNGTNKIAKALSSLDRDTKINATKMVRKIDDDLIITPNEPKVGITKMVSFVFCVVLLSIGCSVLFLFMVQIADNTSKTIGQINQWELYASNRLSSVLEGAHQTVQVISLSEPDMCLFKNRQREIDQAKDSLVFIDEANQGLLKGNNESAPCEGFDVELDQLNFLEECIVDNEEQTFHDTYRCGSISQLISSLKSVIQMILSSADEFSEFRDDRAYHLIHIVNNHLWHKLNRVVSRLDELAQIKFDNMVNSSLAIMIFGIFISIVIFAFGIIIKNFAQSTYNAALSQVKRVPPLQLIANKEIKSILLNKEEEEVKNASASIARNILHKSSDGLLCTSLSGVIEIVNPSVSETLGYTPEQLLGQPISMLFTNECGESVTKEMLMMQEGQRSDIYEDHVVCISDSGIEIHCFATILGMKNDTNVESFVLILRDESELLEQQQNAEKAKAQSENLLFQILPRDIVTKLNQGEKDISFTVPSATIIFIDIVKFSEYASALTPQEIMGNLSLIFAGFDKLIKKYNLLIKIKLIGDIYMAAAGLFSPDAQPAEHATQTIKFGLDALSEIEDDNVRLNANLQIRIGVNTGGPLIAGVLGTDKPVFDIIGDPINVAARLQTTDIPGRIQIPQSTYDLLNSLEFNLEPRGEVFLKGKGKVNTFFVNQGMAFASFELMAKNSEELLKIVSSSKD